MKWTKFKAPSGERWERSETFKRCMMWNVTLKDNYKQLATILQVPEELLKAEHVHISIISERNLDNPFSIQRRSKT